MPSKFLQLGFVVGLKLQDRLGLDVSCVVAGGGLFNNDLLRSRPESSIAAVLANQQIVVGILNG